LEKIKIDPHCKLDDPYLFSYILTWKKRSFLCNEASSHIR
jgi:hypothetical protein